MTRGQIISFYSFKGGVGRTIALANIACHLSRTSDPIEPTGRKRVLMVDWDLDSPGLHYYFYRENLPTDGKVKGLAQLIKDLDLVSTLSIDINFDGISDEAELKNLQKEKAYKQSEILSRALGQFPFHNYYHKVPNLDDDMDLWFMPHSGTSFAEQHNELLDLDWLKIQSTAPWAILHTIEHLACDFDYVLIDSRTGMSDTGFISGGLIPDKMVYVFTLNKQSLHGSRPYFYKTIPIREANFQAGLSAPLKVFPLPSMIQDGMPRFVQEWSDNRISGAASYLSEILPISVADPGTSWESHIQKYSIPYVEQLAFGEQVLLKDRATFEGVEEFTYVKRFQAVAEQLVGLPNTSSPKNNEVSKVEVRSDSSRPSLDSLAKAARYLGWMVSSQDMSERIGIQSVTDIKALADALTYEELGPQLVNISRSYIAIADASNDLTDRWTPVWYKYARELLQGVEHGLNELKVGELPEEFTAMNQGFWSQELWRRAGKGIWTTNVARVGRSFGRTFDIEAIRIQGEAVKRGVPVTRVFVLEENEGQEAQSILRKIVKAQFDEGITVFVIKRSIFDEVKGNVEAEFGSEDFTIVDDRFIYVTERKRIGVDRAASAPTRIRIINAETGKGALKLRTATTFRHLIEAAATKITSPSQIRQLISINNE